MTNNPPNERHKRWAKLMILALFIGGLLLFYMFDGDQYLTLDALKANRDALLAYTDDYYWAMIGATLLVYTISTALSIPGAVILSLMTGFLFGRWVGTGIILFAATLGATLVFIAARYLFADTARRHMGKMAQKIVSGFEKNAFHYLLFLRLVPLFPFWLINLIPAVTPITLRTYISATAIGILPGCFVFANLGQSLGRIDSLDELLSTEILLALLLLGLFALLPVIAKKLKLTDRLGDK